MNVQIQNAVWETNERARRRLLAGKGEPLFFADWERALFIHYEVPAAELQREIPFELDLRDGKAYVSLVAFTMRGMRPRRGGWLSQWLCEPIATNNYLNVRTYVRHRGEIGIYFMAEWLNNRLSVRLGPGTFGLPYRFGKLDYQHSHESGNLSGYVSDPKNGSSLAYQAQLNRDFEFKICEPDSLDEFLLERYTAYTSYKANLRFFRVWHSPWVQSPVEVTIFDNTLLTRVWPWFASAKLVGANYSPGADEVWMGWPRRIVSQSLHASHHRVCSFFEMP